MTVIPFEPRKKQENQPQKNSLLETYFTLTEQIEQLELQIQEKEKKLHALTHWRSSETDLEYQKETDKLRREQILLEKTKRIVMEELMKQKEQEKKW